MENAFDDIDELIHEKEKTVEYEEFFLCVEKILTPFAGRATLQE